MLLVQLLHFFVLFIFLVDRPFVNRRSPFPLSPLLSGMCPGANALFSAGVTFGGSNLGGYVYPAYCSFKAIESASTADDTQW